MSSKRIGEVIRHKIAIASLFAFAIGLILGAVNTAYAHEEPVQQTAETNEVTDIMLTQQANDVEEKTPLIVIIYCAVYVIAIVLCIISLFVVKRRKNNTTEQREKPLESEETVNDE